MSLGVVGLYVGRIFEQVKQRPIFVVRETRNWSVRAVWRLTFDIDTHLIDREVSRFRLVDRSPGGDVSSSLCESARADYLEAFKTTRRAAAEEGVSSFQTWRPAPGENSPSARRTGSASPYAQLLQTIYFDANRPDHASLNSLFKLDHRVEEPVDACAARFRRAIPSGTATGTPAVFTTIHAAADS